MTRDLRPAPGRLLALAAVYFVAGKLGLMLAFVHVSATAVWPPTGLAIAALILFGPGCWPAVLVGAFLVNLTTAESISVPTGAAVGTSIGIAVGNTLEGLAGAYLATRFARGARAFERAGTIFRFALLAGCLATTVSATVGVTSLALGGMAAWARYGSIWITWWLGDAVGALVFAPLLILWSRRPALGWNPRQIGEAVLLLAAVVLTGLVVFAAWLPGSQGNYPLEYLAIPPFMWAAFRFGQRETASVTVVLSVIAIWGTLHDYGPFARRSHNESLLLLQAFVAVAGVMALAVAAVVSEQRRVEGQIRALNEDLERRVAERTLQIENAIRALGEENVQRRHAQAALEATQARLLEAQELAHIGNWEWDVARDVVWWSEELYRLYGLAPESFGASYGAFLDRLHPGDREMADRVVRRSLETGEPFGFEHRIVRPDGTMRVLYGRGRVVLDETGRPVRMFGTGQDITDRKRAEEERTLLVREQVARKEAEEANRLKDEFLATLSHELRTPMNAIAGWIQILHTRPLDEKSRHAVAVLERNARSLTQTIDDVLDVSAMVIGKLRLQMGDVDLPAIVEASLESARPEAEASDIRLDLHIDRSTPILHGDPRRLQQVFSNLLSNAIKFTGPGGRVTTSVRRNGTTVDLQVSDTGVGIRPEVLPFVFDRFRQGDASPERSRRGLGLGLALVRYVVELHGGTVRAESAGEGCGATFSVKLPITLAAG